MDYIVGHTHYVAVSTTLNRFGHVVLIAHEFQPKSEETRIEFRKRAEDALSDMYSPLGREIMIIPVAPGVGMIDGIGSDELNKIAAK